MFIKKGLNQSALRTLCSLRLKYALADYRKLIFIKKGLNHSIHRTLRPPYFKKAHKSKNQSFRKMYIQLCSYNAISQ